MPVSAALPTGSGGDRSTACDSAGVRLHPHFCLPGERMIHPKLNAFALRQLIKAICIGNLKCMLAQLTDSILVSGISEVSDIIEIPSL